MRKKRQDEIRFSYIVLGLILGFFLGSGIVYWYFNRQNGRIINEKSYEHIAELVEKSFSYANNLLNSSNWQQDLQSLPEDLPIIEPEESTPEVRQLENPEIIAETDTLGLDYESPENIFEHGESEDNSANPDGDDTEYFPNFQPPDFLVKQDSLLQIRAFSVHQYVGNNAQKKQYELLDSLVGNFHGRRPGEIMVSIEFWLSPLQYSGYKKSKNRIIVYGIEHPEIAQLHMTNKNIVLEYMDQLYLLVDNDDFQPLVSITDNEFPEQFENL